VLEAKVELRRSRLELMLKVLDVDGAVRRVRGGWESTGAAWTYDAERLARVAAARAAEAQLMLDYEATTACRMEFLRRALDDPEAARCGRCDNCVGSSPYTGEISESGLASSRAHLGRPGVLVPPRRQWPTALTVASGKIPAGQLAETGRVIGRLSDLGWGERLRRLVAPESPDGAVPAEVVGAIVEVLKDWAAGDERWSARPVGIVSVGSVRHVALVRSLAARISEIGQLPVLGEIGVAGGAGAGRANSAHRVMALHDRLSVDSELAARVAASGGPLLLVDDYIDSGWTMAIGSRLLRMAGATSVLPLALGLAG
jgi:ATP-dependent DNA helicase RecQ